MAGRIYNGIMDEERARAVLGRAIQPDNSIQGGTVDSPIGWCTWFANTSEESIILDGAFTLEQLAALVWWVENKLK